MYQDPQSQGQNIHALVTTAMQLDGYRGREDLWHRPRDYRVLAQWSSATLAQPSGRSLRDISIWVPMHHRCPL